MSKEIYTNRVYSQAIDLASSHNGELMSQDRESIRGKGKNEKRKRSYDAIFTFDDPLLCEETMVPERGGYFLTDEGMAEVTQLIGRFESESERTEWISNTFNINDSEGT